MIVLLLILSGCRSWELQSNHKVPQLILEYGWMDCGEKEIEYNGVVKKVKMNCMVVEDTNKLKLWIDFWCKSSGE